MKLEYKRNLTLNDILPFTQEILEKIKTCCDDVDTLFDIRLAFEEVLVNAIRYGNKNDPARQVAVVVVADDDSVTIEVKDEGEGFDHEGLGDPTDHENIEKLSGRGVFLIKNIMDKVDFLDKGNRIKMVKRLPH